MTRKQFGDGPMVEVFVLEKARHVAPRDKVEVNWSCVGAVPIDEAHKFLNHFRQALNFARKEAKRLNKA